MLSKHLKNEIVWSALVQIFGKFAQMGIGLVTIKLVTEALGPEEYGLYGKISEFALFFATAANLGIFGNTVRKMAEAPTDGRLFVNALVLRMGSAFLFFAVGAAWAWLFVDGPAFTLGTLFFLAALFLDYVTSVCDGMLQANYRMGRATLALLTGRIFNLLVVLLLLDLGAPSEAPLFFLAPLSASAVTAGFSLIFVRQKLSFVWKLDLLLLKMLFWSALPFGIINIINSLYFRFLPSYFMAQTLTDEQFGSYTVSLHLAVTASMLSTYFMFSTLPALKQALKKQDTGTVKQLIRNITRGFAVLGFTVIAIGWLLAPTLISLISGESFVLPELWFLFPLLLLLAAISYFYDLVLIVLFALDQELWFLKREGLALGLALIIFSLVYFPLTPLLATFFIVLAPIVSELFIVGVGMKRIRSLIQF